MDTHIHQILSTSIEIRMAPPIPIFFMSKEERSIILAFLHLILFWKHFIDDIFLIILGSYTQLEYTFTYSKQTVSFLDVKIYLWNLKDSRKNFSKNTLTVWHYFTSTPTTHTAVKEVSFVHKHYH